MLHLQFYTKTNSIQFNSLVRSFKFEFFDILAPNFKNSNFGAKFEFQLISNFYYRIVCWCGHLWAFVVCCWPSKHSNWTNGTMKWKRRKRRRLDCVWFWWAVVAMMKNSLWLWPWLAVSRWLLDLWPWTPASVNLYYDVIIHYLLINSSRFLVNQIIKIDRNIDNLLSNQFIELKEVESKWFQLISIR